MKSRLLPVLLFCTMGCEENTKETTTTDDPLSENATIGLSTQTLTLDGENREYLMYVPESYDGSSSYPVLFSFHGYEGDSEGMMTYTSDMRSLAESEDFILVYPQGLVMEGEGTHWNTLLPGALEDNKSESDDFGFVAAMIEQIESAYTIDSSRVYATGYSNGAGFAYSLACHLSDQIAAIAPVSGLMWDASMDNCTPSHPTAVLIINGTSDSVRPYDGYEGYMPSVEESIAYWTNFNETNDTPEVNIQGNIEHYVYSGGTENVSVEHYKVIGGGHVWLEIDTGTGNTDEVIWAFLSRYSTTGLR